MKHCSLCVAAMVLWLSGLCHAQSIAQVSNDAVKKFHLSLDAGLNISTLPGLEQHGPVFGFSLGLGSHIRLSDKWALAPGVNVISPRGAGDVKSLISDASIQNPKTNIVTNYIDIPVLVRYQVSRKVSVAAGPQISFLTAAEQRTKGNLASGELVEVTVNIEPLMHKESFMIPIELSYSLFSWNSGRGLDMKLRYNVGIMEAFTATSIATSTNSTWQIMVSLPFITVVK